MSIRYQVKLSFWYALPVPSPSSGKQWSFLKAADEKILISNRMVLRLLYLLSMMLGTKTPNILKIAPRANNCSANETPYCCDKINMINLFSLSIYNKRLKTPETIPTRRIHHLDKPTRALVPATDQKKHARWWRLTDARPEATQEKEL